MTTRWTVEEYLLRAIEAQQENVGHLYARLDKDIGLTSLFLWVYDNFFILPKLET